MPRHRIFSGIQPTGEPHLGNYLGAIKQWVDQQNAPDAPDAIYSIVDYHALTIGLSAEQLRAWSLDMVAVLIACGLDPQKVILFRQSDVPEHTELAWIFTCCSMVGELERMTQYKEKAAQHSENINAGILTYPVLQTADILLYKADRVPVGEDQVQHLELAREIVRRFNRRFGETFPEPQPLLSTVPRLKGLDGSAKMSKSKGNTVSITETPEQIHAKIKVAVTDPQRLRRHDPGRPEVCGIFTLHQCFNSAARIAAIDRDCRSAAIGCVECKRELADRVVEHFAPIRERLAALRARPEQLVEVLAEGKRKAGEIARTTMDEVRTRIGVRPAR